jgi:hypothetical protein
MRCVSIVFFLLGVTQGVIAQTSSILSSEGVIYNTGTVVVRGDAVLAQPSIGGRVEYTRNIPADSQLVAQITYFDVHFEGGSEKRLSDPSKVLIAENLFSTRDTLTRLALNTDSHIEVRGTVAHYGLINPGAPLGLLIANGTRQQSIYGDGFVPMLTLNNPAGAVVTRGGGMRIGERLDLLTGRMQSSVADNLVVERDGWIWRSDNGSIDTHPVTDGRINVRYYGSQRIAGGAELPKDDFTLQQLVVANRAGLELPWNIVVNDSLVLFGSIFTEPDTATRYSVTYTPAFDPFFDETLPEVDGIMVRTAVAPGRDIVMNSAFTSFRFANEAAMGDVKRIELRSKPNTVPTPFARGIDKVRRFFTLRMLDGSRAMVPDERFAATFGYSWRSNRVVGRDSAAVVETIPDLVGREDSLVLLRYNGDDYVEEGTSRRPVAVSANRAWRYSQSLGVVRNGDFAIGFPASSQAFILYARLLLEGAMRQTGDDIARVMGNELRQRNLVPNTPPNEYPYTLDPLSQSIVVRSMPDSVVDWMIVELRSDAGGGTSYYRSVLLTTQGFLIDPITHTPVVLSGVAPGEYFIVFRHRNHLAVMTEARERIERSNAKFFDFTSGVNVFGGAAAQRVVGTSNGARMFALVAGDVTHDGEVRRNDQHEVWQRRNIEGYSLYDTDMDGIISTADWNRSWNNRGRISAVPR